MEVHIREYQAEDTLEAIAIWNEVVEEGEAFPQMEPLTGETGQAFFLEQSFTGLACDGKTGEILGLYILHPNNIGRCGHICNASYAVKKGMRGRHIGEEMVLHCLKKGRELGFKILQFNAVVKSNIPARALYKKLGFTALGTIPGGFMKKDGSYEDIIPHFHRL